jgi:hypothetical protein
LVDLQAVARIPEKNGKENVTKPMFLQIERSGTEDKLGKLTFHYNGTYPEDGKAFFQFYPANTTTNAEVDREGLPKHNECILWIITNNGTIPLQLPARFNNVKTNDTVAPGINFPYLELQARSTVQIGNTVPWSLGEHYNSLLVAAVISIPALGAAGQLGQNSASFASAVAPLAKRVALIEVQGG